MVWEEVGEQLMCGIAGILSADPAKGSLIRKLTYDLIIVGGKTPENSILQGNPDKVIFTRR